jgi:hypothetical protein
MRGMARIKNWISVSSMVLALAGPAFGLDVIAVAGDNSNKTGSDRARDDINVTGTVVHVDLEGGFWGIIGDDGKRYDVANLPKEFRKQGLRVRFAGKVRPDRVSFHMWGVIVEVVSIEKIGETMSK